MLDDAYEQFKANPLPSKFHATLICVTVGREGADRNFMTLINSMGATLRNLTKSRYEVSLVPHSPVSLTKFLAHNRCHFLTIDIYLFILNSGLDARL